MRNKYNELMNNYNNLKAKNEQDEKDIEALNEEIEKLQKELKALNNKYNEANIIIADYKFKIDNLTESENKLKLNVIQKMIIKLKLIY